MSGDFVKRITSFAVLLVVFLFAEHAQDPMSRIRMAQAAPLRPDQLAYVSEREGTAQIYVVNADGTGDHRLTSPPAENFSPVWSPDGERIAFVSIRNEGPQIFVMNADGSRQMRLASPSERSAFPAWSPDGKRIAFSIFRGDDALIQVANADGTGRKELTPPPGENLAPSWSPDGRLIAFVGRRGHPDPHPYVMNATGSNQRRLATIAIFLMPGAMELVWSRDNQQIFMTGLVAIKVADGSQRRVADGQSPNVSPDGRRIAYVSSSDSDIYVMNVDGSGERRLTPGFQPTWSPDSRRIAYFAGDDNFYVIGAEGGERRLIAQGAPTNIAVGPFVTWRPK